MQNKKKQLAYIGVMVACLGVMAWIWLPYFFPKTSPVDQAIIAENLNPGFLSNDGQAVSSSSSGVSSTLPFGETFDTSIFNDVRFKALIAPEPLSLSQDELGRDNPFLAPGADSQSTVLENSTTTIPATQ